MRIEILQRRIAVYLIDPDRHKERMINLSDYSSLPPGLVRRILEVTGKRIQGKRYKTQDDYLRAAVARFGHYVTARGLTTLPIHFDDWQHLILDFHIWALSTGRYRAKLSSRTKSWDNTTSCWLVMLGEEGLLPRGLMIPKAALPQLLVDHGTARRPRSIGVAPALPTLGDPVSRTMFGPIFWTPDTEALEHVRDTMAFRLRSLDGALDDYWLRLVKDYRTGKNLVRAKAELVSECVSAQSWFDMERESGEKVLLYTHPQVEDSDAFSLAVMSSILRSATDVRCLSAKALKNHPAFMARFTGKRSSSPQSALLEKSSLSKEQLSHQTILSLYLRFLGVLSPLDIAVACAILIRENPNVNPQSILNATLLNVRGKSYLYTTDSGRRSLFSVDKPRAHCRKYAVLTRRSTQVLRHVVRATRPIRELLKRCGADGVRDLFVGSAGGELGRPMVSAKQLNGEAKFSLASYYPELAKNGLGRGTLDFAKIRTTVGILEWFETGSVTLASIKLGNTYRVALENYIPKEVRRMWIERIIRRFQHILISLASYERNFFERLLDTENSQEINSFLAQLVYDFLPGSSVIADEIQRKFGRRFRISLDASEDDRRSYGDVLSISISSRSLTSLYDYRLKWEIEHGSGKEASDPLVALAKLLFRIASAPDLAERFIGVFNFSIFRSAHAAALEELFDRRSASSEQELITGWRAQ